jgi:predicted nucleic acid-binding Zn ribbon protein
MVTAVKSRNVVSKDLVLEMRQAGMPMREIAEKIGRTKERVRQILMEGCGSTDHEYLSTLQLCKQAGLPRNRIIDLYLDGIIVPSVKWDAGHRDYLLWPRDAVAKIGEHYTNHRLCKVCNHPLPKNRIFFCSDSCREERHKYKYMTPEEKKRVLDNIRRYRERRKTTDGRAPAAVLR